MNETTGGQQQQPKKNQEQQQNQQQQQQQQQQQGVGSAVILLGVGLVGALIGSATTYFYNMYQSSKEEPILVSSKSQLKASLNKITIEEVQTITNNFQELIGEGGYGKVFRGNWQATKVAVKCLDENSLQGFNEFKNEVEVLSKYRSPYVISLMAYCTNQKDQPPYYLIYEYCENGSLDSCIEKKSLTNLKQFQTIALQVAKGMLFIQGAGPESIIHFDLKSANILLDINWNAKVADFGLTEVMEMTAQLNENSPLKGTHVYGCPEYFNNGSCNQKTDVYGYGMILCEILLGDLANKDTKSIIYSGRENTMGKSKFQWAQEQNDFNKLYDLAKKCLNNESKKRPAFSDIVTLLDY